MDEITKLELEIEAKLSVIQYELGQAKQNAHQTMTIDVEAAEALMSNYTFLTTNALPSNKDKQ
ncbi:hypothetical protein GCM10007938_39990 [Vibrio zhanjiangensis]|uniref:Uncharacterized protein n=1 Tax=Vibrio zhanjiangensis TaxID=1046128 RepID=A0ABQ6F5K5_9VIBR|nr:hypothetical protein [Vibrio zhanjiangensis]GLT20216.1 hypothetical protein GCM10007938_39990 [Vibrio zhanjiangensis]